MTVTRRGTGSRATIAAAATASGGLTIAPNAIATGHGIPGTINRATRATATEVTSTSATASDPIGRMFALNSRSGVKNAAAQSTGGRKTKNTKLGSSSGITTPGRSAITSP